MKIAVIALCVVLPSLCLCTPLPDVSAVSASQSGASVTGNGGNVSANSSSNSGVTVNNPPAVTPTTTVPSTDTPTPATTPDSTPPCTDGTPPPTTPGGDTTVNANSSSDASVSQQGGSGGKVDASASSSASASVTVSGNKCGKPTVDGFNKYSILVKNEGDLQKVTSVSWMVWKSSSSTTKIETQECVCAPRYLDKSCKASQYKITFTSETDILYEVWGYNGQKVLYISQKLSVTSPEYHIYTSKVVTVAEAASGSQEVIAVQNEQTIKQYFDNGSFGILDTDYKTYMICTTSGENSVTFVSLSQQVYENDDLKQQVSQKVEQVLKVNNLSSANFVEVSSKFDVDITKYQWDKCSQGGQGGGSGGNTNVSADANSSASVDVNKQGNNGGSPSGDNTDIKAGTDSSANVDVKNGGSPSGDKTDVKAGADSSANVDVKNGGTPCGDKTDVKAGADSSSNVDVKNGGKNGSGGDDINASANSNASASVNSQGGSSGKPTQQGFTNYSVLKISNDEFKKNIDKTTWFVAKYTPSQEQIEADGFVGADRYITSQVKAVKFQYTSAEGKFVLKEWAYDGTNLMYIQEDISFSVQDFVILKAEVVNVMKATKDTDVAVKVEKSDQVKTYLSSEYAVLCTDYKNYFVGQTSCDKGSITFVAFIQEIYECEEKQQQFAQQISQALKDSGIDESKLSKLTQKFDVDTNKYNKVKCETDVSKDGTTTTKQETEHEGSGGKTKTETSVTNGPSPSGGDTSVNANTSSDASVSVDKTNNGPSAPPSTGGTSVNANSSSDASVNVNNGGSGTPTPPCTEGSQPPSATPPPPPSTPTPSSISANSSSGSNATVDTTGGNTTVNTNSSSDANVNVNGSP